jgi:hypothetical protein
MDDEVKLGRVGHYSYQEVCQEASITHVYPKQFDSDIGGELPRLVNVHGHSQEGDCFTRRGVPFGHTESPEGEFHLNRDCPWER